MSAGTPPTLHDRGRGAAGAIRLRRPTPADVPTMYVIQSDPESNRMAMTKPRPREVFFARWEAIFADPKINSRVIELDGLLVGSVSVFQAPREGAGGGGGGRATPGSGGADEEMQDCFGYWIAKDYWGRGIASRAVAMFLAHEDSRRPLHATAARTNVASLRILERNGFRCTGYRMGEETDRYMKCEIAEFVLE